MHDTLELRGDFIFDLLLSIMVEHEQVPKDFLKFFPRNLSYSEEGYLDNLSTCATFVRGRDRSPSHVTFVNDSDQVFVCSHSGSHSCVNSGKMCDTKKSNSIVANACANDEEGTSVDPVSPIKLGDGEDASEEGIFVNMMDDLDSMESPRSRDSGGSDPSYFSLESIASPDAGDQSQYEMCNEQCLSDALNKELQKSECFRNNTSDGSLEDKNNQSDTESKKATSNEGLETKFADLKVEVRGEQLSNFRTYLLPVPTSPVYDEPEFNIDKAELRKSSSLKTTKTPPGTPGRKKMVRFADAMGLDLESIRHVIDAENPPKIPASAISDLKVGVEEARRDYGSRYLDLCFPQPCVSSDFLAKVMANKVMLENCVIRGMSITGVVRVANVGYHKCVRVRYSINDWITFYDVMASYVQNSCDGATDKFAFTIVAPAKVGPGSKISFAVSYTVNDKLYWDSNAGKNYDIVCYAKTTPTELEAGWVHFI
ncbi:hypothetical protein ACF0H5_005764 [Mactra antiquata]